MAETLSTHEVILYQFNENMFVLPSSCVWVFRRQGIERYTKKQASMVDRELFGRASPLKYDLKTGLLPWGENTNKEYKCSGCFCK